MSALQLELINVVGLGVVALTSAVIGPLVTYYLARPHLKRVEAKVEEVAIQTNGLTEKLNSEARAAGYADGVADQKLPGPNPGPEGDRP